MATRRNGEGAGGNNMRQGEKLGAPKIWFLYCAKPRRF
jgi:hypothetical protein